MCFVDNAIHDPVCEDHPFATARRRAGAVNPVRRAPLPVPVPIGL